MAIFLRKIGVHKRVQVEEEGLYKVRNGKTTLSGGEKIFRTKPATDRDRECLNYIRQVLENLRRIFVLNPVPGDMRDYVRLTDTELKGNAENISSLLYHLCQDKNKKSILMDIICNLPENEITGIE